MRSRIPFLWIVMFTLLSNRSAATSDSLMLKTILLEKQIMENSGDTVRVSQLLFEKALLYKQVQQYQDALFTLNRIDESSLPDSGRCIIHYERAFYAYMLQLFSAALQEIWAAEVCGLEEPEKRMLYLMILLENERWDDFKGEYIREAGNAGIGDILVMMEEMKTPVLLEPEKYVKKSRVPGLGLISAGYMGKGITSIALQLTCAGFAVYQFYYGYYFTGLFSGVQPARRFYNGGKILTESVIRNANHEKVEVLKRTGYQYIEKLYR